MVKKDMRKESWKVKKEDAMLNKKKNAILKELFPS